MAQLRQLFFTLVLILQFFWSSMAFAESAGMTIQALKSMQLAEQENIRSCKSILKNRSCSQFSKPARDALFRNVNYCQMKYKAAKCDDFFKKKPNYLPKKNDCDVYEVCKQKTTSASIVQGCKDYGVEVTTSLMDSYRSCGKSVFRGVCFGGKLISGTFYSILPLLAPRCLACDLAKAPAAVKKIYNEYEQKFACLDQATQNKMACYIAVQAGTAVVGTGVAAVKFAKLAKEMQALEGAARAIGKVDRRITGVDRMEVKRVGERRRQDLRTRAVVTQAFRTSDPKKFLERRASVIEAKKNLSPAKPVIATGATTVVLTPKEKFSEQYLSREITNAVENERWVELANSPNPPPGSRFFDVENSVMKHLNDTTKDKNMVTALTNKHKELIFQKLQVLAKKYPGQFEPYSDFKSMRFAIVPKPPATSLPNGIDSEFAAAFASANNEFVQFMKENNFIPKGEDASKWFRAGWGDTADQATFASRYSRNAPDTNHMRRFTDADLQETQNRNLRYTEAYRQNVQAMLKGTTLLEESSMPGKFIPTAEVFDALRKTETPEELIAFLKGTSGHEINLKQASILRNYGNMADEFSPGIHIVQREQAILEKKSGGITFDLVGAGSQNCVGTANALVCPKDVEEALKKARDGERSVTESLLKRKEEVRDTVTPILEKYKIKHKFLASGDDMALVPDTPIPDSAKKEIAQALAKTEKPASIRMSSVGSGINTTTDRMIMATQGESVEKATRKYLQGVLPREILDKTVVSIQMEGTVVGQGNVRLVLGEGVSLNAEQRAAFNSAFSKAVQDLKSGYKPIP